MSEILSAFMHIKSLISILLSNDFPFNEKVASV